MKPILLLLGTALLTGGVASSVTVFLLAGESSEPTRQAAAPVRPVDPSGPGGGLESLRGELSMLTRSLADLQDQVDDLRFSATRQALPVEAEQVTPETLAAAGLTPVQIEERMRDIFAAEREREQQEEAVARDERERAGAERQAERLATELGLAAGDQASLAEHLFTSGQKRRTLFDGMREAGFDRDAMRTSMQELREWNTSELYRRFSPGLAAQLDERSDDLFGGGRRGGGGPRRGGNNDNPPGGG